MKDQQNFQLIDGVFSPEDCKEILTNIYTSKIQFHQRKNFSAEVRFGKEDATAISRIPQLQQNLEQILKVLEGTEKAGMYLEIKANITIDFIES